MCRTKGGTASIKKTRARLESNYDQIFQKAVTLSDLDSDISTVVNSERAKMGRAFF